MIKTKINNYSLRFAKEEDSKLIVELIKELSIYENLQKDLLVTEELLINSVFKKKMAKVIIAEFEDKPVGYAMFNFNFSSFIGKPGLYLEDIYIKPEYRKKGFGKIILSYLAKLSTENDCWGMEWVCLNWNKLSIEFYEKIGAIERRNWNIFRLSNENLNKLAEKF